MGNNEGLVITNNTLFKIPVCPLFHFPIVKVLKTWSNEDEVGYLKFCNFPLGLGYHPLSSTVTHLNYKMHSRYEHGQARVLASVQNYNLSMQLGLVKSM